MCVKRPANIYANYCSDQRKDRVLKDPDTRSTTVQKLQPQC